MNLDEIPTTWATTTIDDLVASKVSQDGPTHSTFRYIDIGSVDNIVKRIIEPKELPAAEAPSRARQRVQAGDILVSMTRPNLNAVARVGSEHDGSVASTGFDVLRPKGPFSDWLFAIVRSHDFVHDMSELVQGALYPAIRPSDIRSYPIALPPESEQRRIIAKLDALQSRTRLAREALAAIPTLLDHYRQSVLAAAFLEAAPDFASILADEGATLSTPAIRTLLEVCDPTRGIPYGIVQTGQEYSGGIPTVRCGDIKDFSIAISALKRVDPAIVAQYARTTLLGGEVLIAIRGSVGQVSVAPSEMCGMNISREVAMIPVLPTMDPWFVCYFLASPLGQRQVTDQVKGVAQQGINLGDLHKVIIPHLDIAQQRSVVTAIRRHLGFIKTIEQQIGSISVDHLDQSLLATAFRGELVPQDPADEPASVLLDRIRATRAQAGDAPRSRSKKSTGMDGIKPSASASPSHKSHPSQLKSPTGDAFATLLSALRNWGSLANADAQAATGLDAATVRPLLKRLVAEGLARIEGKKRGTRYVALR